MRHTILVLTTALVLAALIPSAGHARTYVVCMSTKHIGVPAPAVAPRTCNTFGIQGSGAGPLYDLRWRTWGGVSAIGHGRARIKSYESFAVTVVLSQRKDCSSLFPILRPRLYTGLSVTLASGGPWTTRPLRMPSACDLFIRD